jgi:hypothetical protein
LAFIVMAGQKRVFALGVPAMTPLLLRDFEDVDARHKAGHDDEVGHVFHR